MKGLLVLLAIVAVASAYAPTSIQRDFIDDIIDSLRCLQNVIYVAQGYVDTLVNTVTNLSDTISNTSKAIGECLNLGGPITIAQCILSVTNNLQSEINSAIQNVQEAVAGITQIPGDIRACWM